MASSTIEYLRDNEGQLDAVVIPISLWQTIFPESIGSPEELVERIEDYCLSRAMDESDRTSSLSREEALAIIE